MVLIEVLPEKATYLFIKSPSAGAWAISANPGSSQIASFAVANGSPPASVKAKVTGK